MAAKARQERAEREARAQQQALRPPIVHSMQSIGDGGKCRMVTALNLLHVTTKLKIAAVSRRELVLTRRQSLAI